MDPVKLSPLAGPTSNNQQFSLLKPDPDDADLLARHLASYPSEVFQGWEPTPPSQDAAGRASGVMQVGLAQLHPDLFGHLVRSDFDNSASSRSSTGTDQGALTDGSAGPVLSNAEGAPRGSNSETQTEVSNPPFSRSQPYDVWSLPNGQTVVLDDRIDGPNVVYHNGSLGGVAGTFVDDPSDPKQYQTVFTPSGLDPTEAYGFSTSPKTGPQGEHFYDKIVWRANGRQGVLQVDAHGQPTKAFVQETGEAAPPLIEPTDAIGLGGGKVATAGLIAAGRAGLPVLAGMAAVKVATAGLFPRIGARIAEDAELSGPVIFRPLLDATPNELAQLRAFVDASNRALAAGRLSRSGRVSVGQALKRASRRAARRERDRARSIGAPYQGDVGHVPDVTWMGHAEPFVWMDMSPRLNSSLGGQAGRYPVGFRPTGFKVEGE